MSFNETSRTVASARRVVVNGAEALTGFPLLAPDGTPSAPSYSFESDTDTGMYMRSSEHVTTVVDGAPSWCVSPSSNVGLLGDAPSNYGLSTPGSGVVYLNAASTTPTTAPNGGSGGLLFGEGPDLKYTDSGGTEVSLTGLTGDVLGPGASVDNNVARFNGTTGKVIEDSGSFLLTSPSILLTQGNSPGAPPYSFVSDATSGMYNPAANELAFSVGGVRRMHIPLNGTTSDGVVAMSSGSAGSPSVAFAAGGGMFLTGGSSVSFVGGGQVGASVSPGPNVALGGEVPSNYGDATAGSSVIFLAEVSSAPTSAVTSGVSLWVEGNSLMMMGSGSATAVDLTGCIEGPSSAVDTTLVLFDGSSGDLVKSSSMKSVSNLRGPGGSVALPTYGFSGEVGTGMYSAANDTLNFSLLTGLNTSIDTTAIESASRVLAASGTQAAPGMSRVGDTDTGFYLLGGTSFAASSGNATCFVASPAANVSLAGTEASSYGGGESVLFLNQASVDPLGLSAAHGILYIPAAAVDDLVFKDAAGTTTTLTTRISGPTSVSDRSVARWDGSSGRIVSAASNLSVSASGEMVGADGSLGAPTYSFVGDTDTGLCLTGADTLSLSAGGSSVLEVTAAAVDASLGVVELPVGAVGAPSLTFASDTDNGVYHPGADTLALVGGGSVGLTTVLESGAAAPNVTLCSGATDYGGITEGERVVLIEDVSVAPSGTATAGGRLYVSGTSLRYHDDGGGDVDLAVMVDTIGSSTSGAVARANGTGGQIQESGFRINDPTALDYPGTASAAAPTFSFTSDSTSGVYWSSTTALACSTGGVDRLTLGSAAVAVPSVALQADTSLRVGGAAGPTTSLSTANLIENVATAGTGAFAWSNDTGSIMATTASRDLSLTNNLLFTNTTNVLSIGHDGTAFGVDYLPTAGGFLQLNANGNAMFRMGTVSVTLPTSSTSFTVNNRMLVKQTFINSICDYAVAFDNRGMRYFSNSIVLVLGSSRCCHFRANHNMSWGDIEAGGSMVGGISFSNVSTTPSGGLGATDVALYMELSSGLFGFGGYVDSGASRTVFDGARERATISLGALSVTTATSTNTDGEIWSSSDDYGVNGTTTGEMATSDDAIVCFTATADWASNSTGYRRLSIMRKTAGPTYTELNSVTSMAVNGDVTAQTVSFFGALAAATDELTVQVYQDSTLSLSVDLSASFVRYDTDEP
jgi:hypothetical protein